MNNKVILDENVEIQFTGKQPLEEILIKLLLDEFRTFDDEKSPPKMALYHLEALLQKGG